MLRIATILACVSIATTGGAAMAQSTPLIGSNGAPPCGFVANGVADGCAEAPAGLPQLAKLFSSAVRPHEVPYPTRPPWNVPGVDYYVGVPPAAQLVDFHADGAVPPCAKLNKASGLVEIIHTPCQLTAIDFSPHGGACVYISSGAGSSAVKITSSRFSVDAAPACKGAYLVSSGKGFAGDLEIEHNTFLGNGPTLQRMSAAIGSAGSGRVTIQYNYITKFDQHGVDFAAAPTSIAERYNVITDFGMQDGSHPNFTYYCGGTFANVDVEFNLSAEWYGDGAQPAAQGMTIHADAGCRSDFVSPVVAHNVVLAPGVGGRTAQTASYVIAPTEDIGASLSGLTMLNNFVDWTGAYGPIYPSNGSGFRCSGNIDIYRATRIVGKFGDVVCN